VTRLAELVEVSKGVAATPSRSAKVELIAALLRRVAVGEIALAVAWLGGDTGQPRLGVGPALLAKVRGSAPADTAGLTLDEAAQRLDELATASGSGSASRREALLGALFSRATGAERDFLARLIAGELRQGALAGVMLDAIARAAQVDIAAVRRAAMYASAGEVARAALAEGIPGLARFGLQVLSPVAPMLADTAADVDAALAALGPALFEWKLDGARVQVHKAGSEVRVFTRNCNDLTAAVPEIVDAVRALPARDLVLDGEAIALAADGAPQPFQVTMRRFGRRTGVEELRTGLPLSVLFFDCLLLDDDTLVDHPTRERRAALAAALPPALIVPSRVTARAEAARGFLDDALARGHEGVMAKALEAPYEAGRRGGSWRKIKQVRTLDLVVLAAEWGSGRRRGWLSNLHLGARDPATGGFVMLGKTFKGLTDALLEWQTRELLAREIGRDDWTVHVRPELVVEIAYSDLQASPRYPGGLALRFARVKRYRSDKGAGEADTIDTVRAVYATQAGSREVS
jgi:DNA ligase-1